jgi:hypothetical protein
MLFLSVGAFSFSGKHTVRQRGVFITKAFQGVNAFIISFCQCAGTGNDRGRLGERMVFTSLT